MANGTVDIIIFLFLILSVFVDLEILAPTSHKVYGLYSCPVHLLKSVCHSLSPLLASLMNKSISTSIYPYLLTHAKVIPVYKTGDETDPCNYRLISLLSVFNWLLLRNLCTNALDRIAKRMVSFWVLNMDLQTIVLPNTQS